MGGRLYTIELYLGSTLVYLHGVDAGINDLEIWGSRCCKFWWGVRSFPTYIELTQVFLATL